MTIKTKKTLRQTDEPTGTTTPNANQANEFEALIQRLMRISDNHGNNNRNEAPQTGDKLLVRFRALEPDRFDGMVGACQAEQWLREMDCIFETMDCNEIEKRRLAVFQLTYTTADWWDAERATIGEDAAKEMTWIEFRERFLEKYFPETEKYQREKEFIELVQGNMTVREYTTQFERLS